MSEMLESALNIQTIGHFIKKYDFFGAHIFLSFDKCFTIALILPEERTFSMKLELCLQTTSWGREKRLYLSWKW